MFRVLLLACLTCLAAKASIPVDCGLYRDRCDVVEINHVYTDDADPQFTQVIPRAWNGTHHEILGWCIPDKGSVIRIHRHDGRYLVVWQYRGDWWLMRCGEVRQSWTMFDVEMEERQRQRGRRGYAGNMR